MTRRFLKRGLASLFLLIGIAVLGGYAVLFSGPLLPVRQVIAERVLARLVHNPVDVTGPVGVQWTDRIEISLADVAIGPAGAGHDDRRRTFEAIGFAMPFAALAGQSPVITGLTFAGTRFDIKPPDGGTPSEDDAPGDALATLPAQLLKSGLAEDLHLAAITVVYSNAEDGWDQQLAIDKLDLQTSGAEQAIEVRGAGNINGKPFSLSGHIDSRQSAPEALRRGVELQLDADGLSANLNGQLELTGSGLTLGTAFSADTGSLTDFFELFEIEGQTDGMASAEGQLTGPLQTPALSGLTLRAANGRNDRLTLEGSAANPAGLEGLDLTFDVAFAQPAGAALPAGGDGLRIGVTGFDGRVSGSLEALAVKDLQVQTTHAVLNLDNVGPISIERIVRSPEGRLGLEGIEIRHGAEGQPDFLHLTGSVLDAVDARGIEFGGSFRLPFSELLDAPSRVTDALGALEGTMAISDGSGTLSLDDLSARTTRRDLFDLSLDLQVEDFRDVDRINLKTEVRIPSPAALASVLDKELRGADVPFQFDGTLAMTREGVDLTGEAVSGASGIAAELGFGQEDRDPAAGGATGLITGRIASESLALADYAGILSLLTGAPRPASDNIEWTSEIHRTYEAHLDLDISRLVSAGKSAGDIKGRLAYADRTVRLDPIEFSYLGGKISGTYAADLSQKPAGLSAKGRIERWPLGTLLAELGHPVDFSSTLYLSYDISGSGGGLTRFLGTANGRLTASLWGGTLPTRLLDLSGLNLVTWLFSGSQDDREGFVCAVVPLRFSGGSATGNGIILETRNVQVVGNGSVNLGTGALDLNFLPRPKDRKLVNVVTPFSIGGTTRKPEVRITQPKTARAAAEVLSLPLNLVGRMFGAGAQAPQQTKPCRLPEHHGAK
jgi:hypothetical protein